MSRKRQEKFISIKINPAHAQLQERVAYLRAFRRSHEQLRVMTNTTRGFSGLGGDGPLEIDMDEEVRLSYESVKNVDVLDVTPGKQDSTRCRNETDNAEGAEIWYTAETAYNDRVARIENQIISRLRDRLATAKNAQEMFRVFSKFNTLFVRPKVSQRVRLGASKELKRRFEVRSKSTRPD